MCLFKSAKAKLLCPLKLAAFLFLTGCTAVSDYRPIAGNEFGYSDRRLKENSYEVSFKGHKRTTQEEANDFALLRALEIGSKLNYEYMLITSTKDKTSSRSGKTGGGCYSNVYGQQVCDDGISYRVTRPAITIRVQYFDERPTGRYLPESLFVVDTSYEELSEKYGLKAAEVAPLPARNTSVKSDEPILKISMQELYTQEDLIEGGWDLSACYGLASSSYDAGNKDNLISVSFVNDTNTDVYDAYVDLRGNISFLKSRSAGAAYKYNTYLDTNWLWFSDKGKCLGWATATEEWSNVTKVISAVIREK